MTVFIELVFRLSNIVYIEMLSLLTMKRNSLVTFSASDNVTMCFLKVWLQKWSFFHGWKNIHLICLIYVVVTDKDYHS